MTITSIKREFNLDPNIVGIITTDNLTAITTAGYFFGTQNANVELLNNGVWEWEPEDVVLIYYATNLVGFFTYDATTDAFVSLPANGGISNSLPSGYIIVGNSSNIATAVAMSGDATISNTGALTIGSGAVNGSKIANNAVDFSNLALDVLQTATITLSAAQIKALYDTPVQLIASPGAGKMIVIDSIMWDIAFGTTQYTAGGAIAPQYGNAAHGAGPAAGASIAAATLNAVAANTILTQGSTQLNVATSSSENAAVYLSNATADFAIGDSTVTLYVRYHVVTPA